ncbi:MAG: DUF58 domain-containing protein [Deltaproteobacteria bacterium]|nr:MAG: DUF58 domain-containing protein [Deltaproteobacteria bacterium]
MTSATPDTSSREALRRKTAELLREVRTIEVQTSRLVDQHLAGSYQSMFKGQGVVFSEVRPYVPGDEVRAIDWRVTARTGEPHVKLFSEERELTVMLIVDMSRSLDLGSGAFDKRHLVARLAATFAFSAIRNNDRVGLIGFTDRVEVFVPPRKGRKHVLSVLSRILSHEPESPGTDPAGALEYLSRLRHGTTVSIFVSDFVCDPPPGVDPRFERALKIANRNHDIIPVRVEDPIEHELPRLGLVALEDLEAPRARGFVDLGPRGRRRYAVEVGEERRSLERLFRRLSLSWIDVATTDDWQAKVVGFFRRRARRAVR